MRYYDDLHPDSWLYRPLPNIDEAIIDANVIVNAVLISDGLASFVLLELLRRRVKLLTSETAIHEAKSAIGATPDINPELIALVDQFAVSAGLSIEELKFNGLRIKKHDRHLSNLIDGKFNRIIISEDMPLLMDLNECNVHGRSLRECAYSLIGNGEPDQKLNIFGTGVGNNGYIFLKAMSSINEFENGRPYYLFYAENLCSLFYNHETGINIEIGGKIVLQMPIHIEIHSQISINVNYSIHKNMRLDVRVYDFREQKQYIASCDVKHVEKPPYGVITVMNSKEKNRGWLGTLQCFTFGPHRLNRQIWKACSRIIGLAPPVLTADMIHSATALTEILPGHIKQPTFQQVVAHMHENIPEFYPGRVN